MKNEESQSFLPDDGKGSLTSSLNKLSVHGVDVFAVCQDLIRAVITDTALCQNENSTKSKDGKKPYLYDQGGSAIKYPINVTYTLKRLLRGLASSSESTKINYCAALYAFLHEYADISIETIVDWVLEGLSRITIFGDTNVSRSEEANILNGRLLAYKSICAVYGHIKSAQVAEKIIQDVVANIWLKNDHLCHFAQTVLLNVLQCVSETASKTALSLVEAVLKDITVNSLKRNALILSVRCGLGLKDFVADVKIDNNVDDDQCTKVDITSPVLSAYLESVLITAANVSDDALAKQTKKIATLFMERGKGGWSLISKSIKQIIPAIHNGSIIFEQEEIIKVMEKSKTETISIFEVCSTKKESKELLTSFIWAALRANTDESLMTKILGPLGEEELIGVLMGISVENASEYMKFADFCSLLKKKKEIPSELLVKNLFIPLIERKFAMEGREDLMAKIQSVLVTISSESNGMEALDRLRIIKSFLDRVEKEINIELFDEPARDAWRIAMALRKQLLASASGKDSRKKTRNLKINAIIEKIIDFGLILILIDPQSVDGIFEDIKECLTERNGKHEEEKVINVLLDILVLWQSKSSLLLRRVADEIFTELVPDLNDSSIEIIQRVLLTKPNANEDLYGDHEDDADDGEEDEDEDEDDGFEIDEDDEEIGGFSEGIVADEGFSDTGSDSESDSNMEPESKRSRLSLLNTASHIDLSEETAKLDDASEEELNQLDTQLSAIMRLRRAAHSEQIVKRQSLLHFKQRICDWLKIIVEKTSDPKKLLMLKLTIGRIILETISIHTIPREQAERKSKFNFDKEIVEKLETILRDLFKPSVVQKDALDEETKEKINGLLESLLKNESDQKYQIFLFILQHDGDHRMMEKYLLPIWVKTIKDTDRRINSNNWKFLEQMKQNNSLILLRLIASEESMEVFGGLRLFTRQKIVSFVDSLLKKVKDESVKKFIIAMISYYGQLFANKEGLNGKVLREELSLMNTIVAKSRNVFNQEGLLVHWRPIFENISGLLVGLKEATDVSQWKALSASVNSMQSMVMADKVVIG